MLGLFLLCFIPYHTFSETLLTQFVGQMPGLYGETAMTFNVHQLTHLSSTVRRMGPLWANSAFRFEDGNGRLLKQVTAAKGVPQQIVERVVMRQELETLLAADFLPAAVRLKCQRVLGYEHLRRATHVEGVCLLGRGTPVQRFSPAETAAMTARVGFCPSGALEHERFIVNSQVYESTQYRRAKKSNSTVISCHDGSVVVILRALHVDDMNVERCILLCTPLEELEVQNSVFPFYIVKTSRPGHSVVAVLPEDMHSACLLIDFGREQRYVCHLPNTLERD